MSFVFLALTAIVNTLVAQNNVSTVGGGPSGHHGVQIIIYNHICEELVYNDFSVTPWYQGCNPNQQETWDEPESISPGNHGYIVYQGHANVGVAGAVQWNIGGDQDRSVIVYYRASVGNGNGGNSVMVWGDSIHYDTAYPDMLENWFSGCNANDNDEYCNNPCWSGECRPFCTSNWVYEYADNKNVWNIHNIENTDYRVTGNIDGGDNPYLNIFVENSDGSACDGMHCPVIFHLDKYEICGFTLCR